jgi:hypothetical protein
VFQGLNSGRRALPEIYDFPDSAARYLRLVGHGNSLSAFSSIAELTIF